MDNREYLKSTLHVLFHLPDLKQMQRAFRLAAWRSAKPETDDKCAC
jgi:hypothetical protein